MKTVLDKRKIKVKWYKNTETEEKANDVLYLFPNEENIERLEREFIDSWRVWTGNRWKFGCNSRQQAINLCKRLGGEKIGLARWCRDQGLIYVHECNV